MENITVAEAAAICGGRLFGSGTENEKIGSIIIDSRLVSSGDVFAAYKGEKVDGHDYISAAMDKGAACCIAEHVPEGESRCVIVCDDVQAALEKISAVCRDGLEIPIIGITGSVGKTTAKEMISAVLSQRLSVLKTDKNLNNQIGVPMTISRIRAEHQAAVVEMGISGIGDMEVLAKIVRPTVMVFTVIGHAHLEFLHDLDGVFHEKTAVLAFMPDNGLVIVNGDDPYQRKISCKQKIISYGLGDNCDVKAENIEISPEGQSECVISYGDRKINAHIPAYGQHMVYAALEGAAVGFAMGFTDEEIQKGIAAYETVGRRAAVNRTPFLTLVDDSYNANPDSMRCAMDSFIKMKGRHVCIFGDMLEMGEQSPNMHRDIGAYAKKLGVELMLCCGELAEYITEGFGAGARHFCSIEQLISALPELICAGDAVLVKASRGAHFETVAEELKKLR